MPWDSGCPCVVFFVKQVARNFAMALDVKPIDQPPCFGSLLNVTGKKWRFHCFRFALLFGKVFGDWVGAAQNHMVLQFQNGQVAAWVHRKKRLAPRPWQLDLQFMLYPQFTQHRPNGSGMRAQREVCQPVHVYRFVAILYGKWSQLRFIQSQLQLIRRRDITDSPVNRYIHNGATVRELA